MFWGAKKVFHFKERVQNQFFFSFAILGVSTTEGDPWEAQRNFLHSHLLNLVKGKGSQGFHDIIMDEVSDLKMELSKKVAIRSLKTYMFL